MRNLNILYAAFLGLSISQHSPLIEAAEPASRPVVESLETASQGGDLDRLFDHSETKKHAERAAGRRTSARPTPTSKLPHGKTWDQASAAVSSPRNAKSPAAQTQISGSRQPPLPTAESAADKSLPARFQEFEQRHRAQGIQAWIEKFRSYANGAQRLLGMLPSEILSSGENWEEISRRLESSIQKDLSGIAPRSFENPRFVEAFERSLNTKFVSGNRVEALIDGPASFERRFALIDQARSSIHILSWAIYDDETGFLAAQKLIRKAREGVRVRIIVDEQTQELPGHGNKILPYLRAAGIPVILWRDAKLRNRYHGMHRKILIVDSQAVIAGGMNFGDEYSHLGAHSTKWRDTDVLMEGPTVIDSERLFARIWNDQISRLEEDKTEEEKRARRSKGYVLLPELPGQESAAGQARVALLEHGPGRNDLGLKSALFAIEGARHSLDIENAYFILNPVLLRALQRARDRGVRVRILTNSDVSVDEPVVTYPIMKSAEQMRQERVEVYLRKGSTLHSKFIITDDTYVWVGSYNLHPRSFLIEEEAVYNVLDPALAARLREAFENDIAQAQLATRELQLPNSWFSRFVYTFFHNQI